MPSLPLKDLQSFQLQHFNIPLNNFQVFWKKKYIGLAACATKLLCSTELWKMRKKSVGSKTQISSGGNPQNWAYAHRIELWKISEKRVGSVYRRSFVLNGAMKDEREIRRKSPECTQHSTALWRISERRVGSEKLTFVRWKSPGLSVYKGKRFCAQHSYERRERRRLGAKPKIRPA